MRVNFVGHDVTWPYDVPCTILYVKCSTFLNTTRLHIGTKKERTLIDILPQITLFSTKWLLPTRYYRMGTHFFTGNENVPYSSCIWKGKDLKDCFKITKHIEEIGGLEGKKYLFEDTLVQFFRGDLESHHLQRTTREVLFHWDFQVLFGSLQRVK